MVKQSPSSSAVLPQPICLVCGVELLATDHFGMPKEYPRLKKNVQYWRRRWKPGPEHLMVSSYEAENAYLDRFPELWCCLYRASKSHSSEFVVTESGSSN